MMTRDNGQWASANAMEHALYWAHEAVQLAREDLEAAIRDAERLEWVRLELLQQNLRALRGDPFPGGICPVCLGEHTPCFAISGNQQIACWMPNPAINPPLYVEAAAGGELVWFYDYPALAPAAGTV